MNNSGKKILVENPNFSQSTVIFDFVCNDASGSMDTKEKTAGVRRCLKILKNTLLELENTSSTRVCVITFGSSIEALSLRRVETFSTDYSPRSEGTRFYDTLVFLDEKIQELYKEYHEEKGYNVVFNIYLLTDGYDYGSSNSFSDARRSVSNIKEKNSGIICYNIGCDKEVTDGLGITLKSVEDTDEGMEEMSMDISQSMAESSQSGIPIGMELSQSQMSQSSVAASEEFKEAIRNVRECDMFELLDQMF